jgi:CBS domain containing-hemolysin-like protein
MSTTELLARLAAGVLLTGMNAFFVTTEFALTRLRQFSEEEIGDHPGLKRAWEMTRELEIYLTGCQLGITTTSILLGVVAEPAVTWLLRPAWNMVGLTGTSAATASVITSVVVINLIHKVWGEQAPTYLGVERPLQVARWTAPVHYWWTRAMYPVIKLGDGIAKATLRTVGVEMSRSWVEEDGAEEPETDDRTAERAASPSRGELRKEMGEVLTRGGVAPDRRREVLKALEIQRIPVRDIMVPAEDVTVLDLGSDLDDNLDRIRTSRHSRFPLVRGPGLDAYQGIIYVTALLMDIEAIRADEKTLADVAAEPVEVSPELPVSELIDYLQEEGQELALVREGSEIIGLVTVTDALEVITGELTDPLDRDRREREASPG